MRIYRCVQTILDQKQELMGTIILIDIIDTIKHIETNNICSQLWQCFLIIVTPQWNIQEKITIRLSVMLKKYVGFTIGYLIDNHVIYAFDFETAAKQYNKTENLFKNSSFFCVWSLLLQVSYILFGMLGGPLLGVFTLGVLFPWANKWVWAFYMLIFVKRWGKSFWAEIFFHYSKVLKIIITLKHRSGGLTFWGSCYGLWTGHIVCHLQILKWN